MQLLEEFRRSLNGCTQLLVVGYSFGDAHIDTLIRRWLAQAPTHRVVVIDPYFPELSRGFWRSPAPERETFWQQYGPGRLESIVSGTPVDAVVRRELASQFDVVRETAAEALDRFSRSEDFSQAFGIEGPGENDEAI